MSDTYENLLHTNIKPFAELGEYKLLSYIHKGEAAKALGWAYEADNTIAIDIDAEISNAEFENIAKAARASYLQVWESSPSHSHIIANGASLTYAGIKELLSKFGDKKFASVVCHDKPMFALRISPLNGHSKKLVKEIGAPWLASETIKAHQWLCELAG